MRKSKVCFMKLITTRHNGLLQMRSPSCRRRGRHENFLMNNSPAASSEHVEVDDGIDALLKILPYDLRDKLLHKSKQAELLEVSMKELEYAQSAVGEFGEDNRAYLEGTLHRISAIRSRKGEVVGLTCRVGRAVHGQIGMVQDLLQFGKSILFVGRPGVGKTTVMREISRVLSDELQKRVVIIDTRNEIAGGGDVPHPAIGGARRIQVPEPFMQHGVMIEAVENHMPEVIIVDEIGTEAEVQACRSIAERGIMLIGTAHGERLENIVKNPILSFLIGGLEAVTLGDQEAGTRKCKKSILERKAPPTFPFLVEMRERYYWVTHRTERSVDLLLRGKTPLVEVRRRDNQFKVVIERWKTADD
ncbi:hypothetical protein U1Q18_007511 [Sarracenia purpurea var. burkii]